MQTVHEALSSWNALSAQMTLGGSVAKDGIHYEERIRRCFNHLYANANIRTSEGITAEVAKIILGLAWTRSQNGGVAPLSRQQEEQIRDGDPDTATTTAHFVRTCFESMNSTLQRYESTAQIELDDASTAFVYQELHRVPFEDLSRDWLGDAAEVFRSLAAKRLGGQFFTDQRVTELAVDLLEFGSDSDDDFVDICAGTGGFLIAAAKRKAASNLTSLGQQSQLFSDDAIKGLEVDPELAHLANASLIALGRKLADCVLQADSLIDRDWDASVRRHIIPGTHRCLASNPPFGTKITIKNVGVLEQYELARTWRKQNGRWVRAAERLTPRPPDLLFIERNLQLAEPGIGRVALVTPYQVLSGPQLGFVRDWILRHARIRAIIDLPAETFQPWTGTKTSLLVMERRAVALEAWEGDDYEIFMSVAEFIGHDRRGNPTLSLEGAIRTDLPHIGQAFAAWRRGEDPAEVHPNSFTVKASDIHEGNDLRLNAAFYRPARRDLRSQLSTMDSTKWEVRSIGELTERIFYPTRFKRDYVDERDGGVLFLSGTNISQMVPTNRKYLSKENPKLDELRVNEGWVLVTRSGSTGIVSSVPRKWDGLTMSEHVIRIVPNPELIHPGYLEAYLRSEIGQELLAAGIFGSVIDEITPEHIAAIPIPIPIDPAVQSKIGSFMHSAQEARNSAIANLDEGVTLLEEALLEEADSHQSPDVSEDFEGVRPH